LTFNGIWSPFSSCPLTIATITNDGTLLILLESSNTEAVDELDEERLHLQYPGYGCCGKKGVKVSEGTYANLYPRQARCPTLKLNLSAD